MTDATEIYLDYAASSPLLPGIAELWSATATKHHANPTGVHFSARRALKALDKARFQTAEALGFTPGEIVFTSGGSEADNMAIWGALETDSSRNIAITTAAEHHSVLNPVKRSGGIIVGVNNRGTVNISALADALSIHKHTVALVSVIAVNNETGSITPLREVANTVRKIAPKALLHTDASQAMNWIELETEISAYDLVSVSGHKIGAPVGIGALIVRDGVKLNPLIIGGSQQRGRRAGTPDVASAVAFAAAITQTVNQRDNTIKQVTKLRDTIFDDLTERLDGRVFISASGADPAVDDSSSNHADRSHIAAGIANVCFRGIQNEALLFLIDNAGVQASAASSCSSGSQDPSHVLASMGIPHQLARGSLRLSLGHATTKAEVLKAVDVIAESVEHLYRFGGG